MSVVNLTAVLCVTLLYICILWFNSIPICYLCQYCNCLCAIQSSRKQISITGRKEGSIIWIAIVPKDKRPDSSDIIFSNSCYFTSKNKDRELFISFLNGVFLNLSQESSQIQHTFTHNKKQQRRRNQTIIMKKRVKNLLTLKALMLLLKKTKWFKNIPIIRAVEKLPLCVKSNCDWVESTSLNMLQNKKVSVLLL